MQEQERELLKQLLTRRRVLALAVLVNQSPYVGMTPFAMRRDFGAILIHASQLALHTRGLLEGAPFGVLIHAPDRDDVDPLQLPRLSLQGTVQILPPDHAEYDAGRSAYVAKLPSSAAAFELGDFQLYQLRVEKGRFIAGFGGIHPITPATLNQLAIELS